MAGFSSVAICPVEEAQEEKNTRAKRKRSCPSHLPKDFPENTGPVFLKENRKRTSREAMLGNGTPDFLLDSFGASERRSRWRWAKEEEKGIKGKGITSDEKQQSKKKKREKIVGKSCAMEKLLRWSSPTDIYVSINKKKIL